MTTSSDNQRNSNNSRLSSDSGIYVPLEIPFSEVEETENKSLVITFQDKDNGLAKNEDNYQDVNVVIDSNPGLVSVRSTTLVSPEVGSTSRADNPPPVPPKCLKPKFKSPHDENEPFKNCQKTPLLSGATGSNQSSHFTPGEELNTAVDANTNPYLALLPHEPPDKRHQPKMSDTEERRTEWEAKAKEKNNTTCQQQSPLEKNKIAESSKDASVTERHQDVGKCTARREMLVIFDNEVQCKEWDQQMELEAGWLTRLLMTENVSESTEEDSDFSSEEEHNVSKDNAEPVSAKPQPKPLPAMPPKILKKCPPKLPAKPPGLCYARRPDVEEKEESAKKEEDEQQGKEERREHVKGCTLPGQGQTMHPNYKKLNKGMKTLTKFIDRLKENREEKKRMKAGEMTMDRGREQDAEVWDKEKCKEEKRLKDKEDEETGDDAVDQTPVTHVEMMLTTDKRTNESSDSVFGSFKVNVPVMLVTDLLSGEEWSQFLDNNQKPDPPPLRSDSEDTAQLITTVLHSEEHQDDVAVLDEHIYEEIKPYDPSNITAGSQTCVEQKRVVSSAPVIVLESETAPLSPRIRDMLNSVEFLQPPMDTNTMFSDFQSEGVLDTSVQKYLIRLSKKRKRRAPLHHRRHLNKKNDFSSQPHHSTSAGKRLSSSVFYNVPCSGGEEPLPTVKSGRGNPRPLTKIKMALKDKTQLRAAQPKEDRGK